jgi:hypothetical protein
MPIQGMNRAMGAARRAVGARLKQLMRTRAMSQGAEGVAVV